MGTLCNGSLTEDLKYVPVHHYRMMCPACNLRLTERIKDDGHTFLGCIDFPNCTYTEQGGRNPSINRSAWYQYSNIDDEYWDDVGEAFGGQFNLPGIFDDLCF